jgi:hypothetical protein
VSFLTIFTAPKPFTDPHIATIQRNAIRSWVNLGEEVQVLLIGAEEGVPEAAAGLGVKHLPGVRCNQWGTPLVSSIFDLARQNSDARLLAYLNADIMIMPDFVEAVHQVASQTKEFLIVGRRWDLEVCRELDFANGWPQHLRAEVEARGRLHAPAGSDYFVFPRQLYTDMPDFAIGRAGWDNWAIFKARQSGWDVIDATPSLVVIHQDHDYSHLPEGRPHYDLEESRLNTALAGGSAQMYTVLDTNKVLLDGKIRSPAPSLARLLRRAEVLLMNGERQGLRYFLFRRVKRLRRRITGTL